MQVVVAVGEKRVQDRGKDAWLLGAQWFDEIKSSACFVSGSFS